MKDLVCAMADCSLAVRPPTDSAWRTASFAALALPRLAAAIAASSALPTCGRTPAASAEIGASTVRAEAQPVAISSVSAIARRLEEFIRSFSRIFSEGADFSTPRNDFMFSRSWPPLGLLHVLFFADKSDLVHAIPRGFGENLGNCVVFRQAIRIDMDFVLHRFLRDTPEIRDQ